MKFNKLKLNAITLGLGLWLAVVSITGCANQPVLKDALAKDFLIGTALNTDQIEGRNLKEAEIIAGQFNAITPENSLKWGKVHPEPDRYDFAAADQFVALGQKNKMFIVGHTLVWHSQTPAWVFNDADGNPATREQLLARMKDHIFTVVGRYKGQINGWDVVNEAITENGTLRKSRWRDIIGEDYIEKAFEYAHEADPEAELYYNDYDMWKADHRDGVIRLVKSLQAKGLRVDGIGMQGHWGLDYPPLDEAETAIVAYAALGDVMITEMEITVLPIANRDTGAEISQRVELRKELNPYPNGLPEEMQQKLTARYAEIFALFHKHADKISRVTLWGVQDGNSWRNYWPVEGRMDYPLLFDRDCKPKPAFDAVIKAVQSEAK